MVKSENRRIIVVGAVAAGTSAAAKARRNDENAEIVVYEMDSDISYSGCGLPYYIGGSVPDIQTLTPRDPRFFLKKYNVDIKIRHQVIAGDSAAKTLRIKNLDTGEEFSDRYDVLVIATGAKAIVPPIPGADLPHLFKLRNPSDARAIKSFIDENRPVKAAVIGSGFIGLEMVENLMAAGMEINLIEKLDYICPFVDPDMAPYLVERLEKAGVRIHAGTAAYFTEHATQFVLGFKYVMHFWPPSDSNRSDSQFMPVSQDVGCEHQLPEVGSTKNKGRSG